MEFVSALQYPQKVPCVPSVCVRWRARRDGCLEDGTEKVLGANFVFVVVGEVLFAFALEKVGGVDNLSAFARLPWVQLV